MLAVGKYRSLESNVLPERSFDLTNRSRCKSVSVTKIWITESSRVHTAGLNPGDLFYVFTIVVAVHNIFIFIIFIFANRRCSNVQERSSFMISVLLQIYARSCIFLNLLISLPSHWHGYLSITSKVRNGFFHTYNAIFIEQDIIK